MIVNNGIIEEMFIEPEEPGDPFSVSDADTVMRYIDSEFVEKPEYLLITKEGCTHCAAAKTFLKNQGLSYQEMVVGRDLTAEMAKALSGKTTYPMIFLDGQHIGGREALIESMR
jgi:glutaredoxin